MRDDYYHDDPVERSYGKNFFKRILAATALVFGSVYLFQTTFAANISLNSGQAIQFGQGLTQAVACSGNSSLTLSSGSTFVNGAGATGAHYLSSVTVSGIPNSCFGTDFVITAYDNASSTPLTIFNSTSTEAVVYNNNGTFTRGIGSNGSTVSSGSGTFTVTFDSPVALASSVYKLGIQSKKHSAFASMITTGEQSCALLDTGGLRCWGSGTSGQIGDGGLTNRLTPVDVSGLTSGVSAVSSGNYHVCALLNTGAVKCWGYNNKGQLGNSQVSLYVPEKTAVSVTGLSSGVSAISAGNNFTGALLTNGGVKCWGNNSEGQLGNGTTTDSSSPVTVSGLSSSAISIATGYTHACAVLTNGTVKCWGSNSSLELGNGNPVGRSTTPVDVLYLGTGVKSVAAGGSHSCALFNAGNVKCWGSNSYGQTGNSFLHWQTGVADVGNLNSSAISIDLGNSHSCAVLSTGAVRCWGLNNYSQLGNGGTTNTHLPVTVSGLSSGVTSVSGGVSYSCATISDGGVKCWGINSWGTLGDGTTTTRSTPVSVNGLF